MTKVAVVDYGAGNLVSIAHALARVGADVVTADRPAQLHDAAAIVVPGVGASGPAMRLLRRRGLVAALDRRVADGVAFLGICLGMQLLFDTSDEDGAAGLGWLRGRVRPIPNAPRLPHIGWNLVEPVVRHPLLPRPRPYYFVHSYAADPEDPAIVVARTTHGGSFASMVAIDRIVGVQFHPEKSGSDGLAFLAAFVDAVGRDGPLEGSRAAVPGSQPVTVHPGVSAAHHGDGRAPLPSTVGRRA